MHRVGGHTRRSCESVFRGAEQLYRKLNNIVRAGIGLEVSPMWMVCICIVECESQIYIDKFQKKQDTYSLSAQYVAAMSECRLYLT